MARGTTSKLFSLTLESLPKLALTPATSSMDPMLQSYWLDHYSQGVPGNTTLVSVEMVPFAWNNFCSLHFSSCCTVEANTLHVRECVIGSKPCFGAGMTLILFPVRPPQLGVRSLSVSIHLSKPHLAKQ